MGRYARVVLKVSGQALAGAEGFGLSSSALDHVAGEILSVHELGVQAAVMVGGGNIFRGSVAEEWGIDRAEADSVGMLGTAINAVILRGAIKAKSRGEVDVRVMTALPLEAVAEPYIRLRAIRHLEKGRIVVFGCGIGQPYVTTDYPAVQRALEIDAEAILAAKNGVDAVYSADPKLDPAAVRYRTLGYDDVIGQNLKVMDQSAFILARDFGLAIHVFDLDLPGQMRAVCQGENPGTLIAPGVACTAA
ncbi:MAG: UMP kinase [Acidimicrobiales bacterium]